MRASSPSSARATPSRLARGRAPAGDFGPTAGSFSLLGGLPIRESVARYGPFVMNTREEIIQAVEDYQAGRMGVIPAIQMPHQTSADEPAKAAN